MKRGIIYFALLGSALTSTIWAHPARADDLSQIRAELEALKAENKVLAARLDSLQKPAAAPAAPEARVPAETQASAEASSGSMPFRFAPVPDATTKAALAAVMGASAAKSSGIPVLQIYEDPDTRLGLYGIVDLTVDSLSEEGRKGTRQTGLDVSWMSGNRWGITGSHKIGEGLDAIFRLESEFELPTGNMDTPGVLFNRDAWVGVYGDDIGKITGGRQNTLGRDFIQNWANPYGSTETNLTEGGWNNNAAMQYLIWYGGGARGTRQDSSVVWKKQWGRWVTGLSYEFGSLATLGDNSNIGSDGADNPGKFSNGSTESAALAYNGDGWNADGLYTHANVRGYSHQVEAVGGNYQVGPVLLMGGYVHYTAEQAHVGPRTDNVFTVGAKFTPGGKFDYELAYYDIRTHNAGGGDAFNPFHDTSGFAAGSAISGSRRTVYGSVFYRIDKVTDVYLAADLQLLGGGVKSFKFNTDNIPPTTSKNADEVGAGFRYKF